MMKHTSKFERFVCSLFGVVYGGVLFYGVGPRGWLMTMLTFGVCCYTANIIKLVCIGYISGWRQSKTFSE